MHLKIFLVFRHPLALFLRNIHDSFVEYNGNFQDFITPKRRVGLRQTGSQCLVLNSTLHGNC